MIGIANDHRGVLEKNLILDYFDINDIEYIDFGTNSNESVDYVDYATKLCNSLNNKEIEKGILICGTGIGMSIAANKIKGIRCARVINSEDVKLAREHNDANVIAIPEFIEDDELIDMLDIFINTPFSNEEKHQRRVNKINN